MNSVAADVDWHFAQCGWDSDWRHCWTNSAQAIVRRAGVVVQSRHRSIYSILRTAAGVEQFERFFCAFRQATDYYGGCFDARKNDRRCFAVAKRLQSSRTKGEGNDHDRKHQ